MAVLNFLADSFPEVGLGGDGTLRGRAEVNRWLAFVNSDVHPAFKPLFGTTAYLEDEAIIGKTKDAARSSLRGLFERADTQLAANDWIAGSRSIADRSEEHTSELQSLMRHSYAAFCLQKKQH